MKEPVLNCAGSKTSARKIAANQRNAQRSTGPSPSGRERTRFNARKHGLTARMAWSGEDPQQDEEFYARAWDRLGPRNAIEELRADSIIQMRLRDRLLLEAERTVLTRRSPDLRPDDAAYPCLFDPHALKTLDQLARHTTHFTRVFDQDVRELLDARKRNRGTRQQSGAVEISNPDPPATTSHSPVAAGPESGEESTDRTVSRGGLEELLSDHRIILPGEDTEDYDALARSLWAAYEPANLLQEFVVWDLIQVQWQVDRVLEIQSVLLARCAISATGTDCGPGFAFLHDCQGTQALETLRTYESALRKRMDRRVALWRKLRQADWQDAAATEPPPATQPAATAATPAPASPPTSPVSPASTWPTESGLIPDVSPTAETGTLPVDAVDPGPNPVRDG